MTPLQTFLTSFSTIYSKHTALNLADAKTFRSAPHRPPEQLAEHDPRPANAPANPLR